MIILLGKIKPLSSNLKAFIQKVCCACVIIAYHPDYNNCLLSKRISMPKTTPYSTTLLLDLDETVFISLTQSEFDSHRASIDSIKAFKGIHPAHTLSNAIENSGYYFFVINPGKLKAMIEAIYNNGDDIVIFTSGGWLKPILFIISILCELSEEASNRFNQSLFLNRQHDSEKLGFSPETVSLLLKGYRLHGLFRSVPELRSRHFVLLDNDESHIASCEHCDYLDGVRATTDEEHTNFYEQVLEKMQLAHRENVVVSPSASSYVYPEAVLAALREAAKVEGEAPLASVPPSLSGPETAFRSTSG